MIFFEAIVYNCFLFLILCIYIYLAKMTRDRFLSRYFKTIQKLSELSSFLDKICQMVLDDLKFAV